MSINFEKATSQAPGGCPFPPNENMPCLRVSDEVLDFANKTEDFAQRILSGNQPRVESAAHAGPQVVNHHHYHDSSWWWYSRPRTVYVETYPSRPCYSNTVPRGPSTCSSSEASSRRSRRKDNSDNTALFVIAAVGALAVGIAALVSAGSTYGKYNNEDRELEETQQIKAKLLQQQNLDPKEQRLVHLALKTAEQKEKMCLRLVNSSAEDWSNKLLLMGGCGTGLAGGVIGATGAAAVVTGLAPTLLAFGAGMGLISACKMLFKSAVDSASTKNISDANALITDAAVLRFEARKIA